MDNIAVMIAGIVVANFLLAVKDSVMASGEYPYCAPRLCRGVFLLPHASFYTLIFQLKIAQQAQHEKRRHRTFNVGKPKRGVGRHSESVQPPFRLSLMPVKEFHRYLP